MSIMGVFGPSEEDLQRVQSELDETKAELAVTSEKLDGSRTLLLQSQTELDRTRQLANISDLAERALSDAEQSGEVQIDAAATAQEVVKKRYVDGATGVIANQLIDEQSDAMRIKHGPEWDEEIRNRLKLQFERDGTFARIADEVDAEAIKAIADSMRADITRERDDFNNSQERQDELHTAARRELDEKGDTAKIHQERDAEAEARWREQALDEVHAEIDAEQAAREEDFKRDWKQKWRESSDGQYHTRTVKEKLQRKWEGAASEDVAREIEDEELERLLKERAEREKSKLENDALFDTHLASFGGSGIEVEALPKDASVTIYLGRIETSKSKDSYGYDREDGQRVAANRVIRLTKLDDGRFRVEYDSMHDSASPYEVAAALRYGEVIHIGRKVVDKGVISLDTSIRQGVPLFTDDDTTDQNITPTHLPVANVEVNGISAVKGLKKPRMLKTVYEKG